MSLWYVGVLFSVLASLFGAFGNHLVKYAHRKLLIAETLDPTAPKRKVYKEVTWILGIFSIVVLNVALNLAALAFAAQSLLAPLAGLTLVWNVVMNPLFLKEVITRADIGGVILAVPGVAVCSVYGSHVSPDLTSKELAALWGETAFLIYCGVAVCIAAFCVVTAQGLLLPSFGTFTLPVLGGLVGAFSAMLAKSVVEVLKSAINGGTDFQDPVTYGFIVAAIVVSLTQLKCLNLALKRYEARIVVPVYQSSLLLFGIVTGYIFFEESNDFTTKSYLLFFLGVALIIGGIVLIGSAQKRRSPDENSRKLLSDVDTTTNIEMPSSEAPTAVLVEKVPAV